MSTDSRPLEAASASPAAGGRVRGGRRRAAAAAQGPGGKRITVVTVVFNAADAIEETLLSVIRQSHEGIEYIVVDGGSTDGTLQLIERHDRDIDLWISEQDTGIYNAMNKGIDLSTGDWIIFMNAGDRFHSNQTVERVVDALDGRFAVVAGGVRYLYDAGHARVKHMTLKFSGFYMSVPHHQASFINNGLLKRYRYDESFRIRGDLDLITRLHADGHEFRMIDEVISDVDTNGVSSGLSNVHITEEIRAGRRVIPLYGLKCIAYHALYVAPRLMVRKLLPRRVESRLRSMVGN